MPREKITSQQVAERAGVSQSAVSRVFSGASASQATVKKVRKAAEELGYRPNVLARSLITGRSRIIGLVVAYLENQFYPDALERLSNALQARGYHILIFTASGRGEGVDTVIAEIMDYQVDGIITASVGVSDKLTSRCEAAGIPVVLFNRGQDDPRLAEVTSDNRKGAQKVAEFLVAGGHRRIAHISGWQGSSTGRDRAAGFREGLARAGMTPSLQVDGHYRRETAAAAALEMCRGPDRPDAIFVGNDHMAFGVIDALRFDLGLRVPEDVSVVGYDDVPMAAWPAYKLTTLRQPSGRMVAATVETLLNRIENPGAGIEKIKIDGPLIVRDSARKPETWP
mgnify:CR=1 FL=1